jgi:drug/metabolite transporter (DMT)-like permease
VATAIVAPFALASPPAGIPPLGAVAAATVLGMASGGLGWILYYVLLARAGPARASLSLYLVPAFAVLYGVALLGEPATRGTLAGLVLVIGGSVLAAGGGPRPTSPAAAGR